MNAKELIEEVLKKDPSRDANYCDDCHEYVESPMMVCRYQSMRQAKIFVDDKNTKKLARMLLATLDSLESLTVTHDWGDTVKIATEILVNLDQMAGEE